jgi:hypothetical protein
MESLLYTANSLAKQYEVVYHDSLRARRRRDEAIREALKAHTVREVAEATHLSVGRVHAIAQGKTVRPG